MERIIYGSKLAPTLFEENIYFDRERPYTLSIKKFPEPEYTIPHYAETIELLVCDSIEGDLYIEKNRYKISGNNVFVIQPFYVHSMLLYGESGVLYVVKLSLRELGGFLRLEGFLDYVGADIQRFPYTYNNYGDFRTAVERLIAEDGDVFRRMMAVLELFRLLCAGCSVGYMRPTRVNSALTELIDWTLGHYSERILLDDAAALMGYSKYYFCKWFKSISGVTYLEYLTQVRAIQASRLLLRGASVAEAGRQCGYENISHFIRVFKKVFKCTPSEYPGIASRE